MARPRTTPGNGRRRTAADRAVPATSQPTTPPPWAPEPHNVAAYIDLSDMPGLEYGSGNMNQVRLYKAEVAGRIIVQYGCDEYDVVDGNELIACITEALKLDPTDENELPSRR